MDGKPLAATPLLVPSFSSKGFPDVQDLISSAAEVITDTILVSAYDVHRKHISVAFEFPEFIFLDSGGYESSKDAELSDLGQVPYKTDATWTRDQLLEVLGSWPNKPPTVLVSYDHPNHRVPIRQQISEALELFDKRIVSRELLIKPETKDQEFVHIENVVRNVHQLEQFDVIGFTEKELGSSPLHRMIAIAQVRKALQRADINVPIHIFGSLDTVSTPLYFIAGADIFDGLTWLRMAYKEGYTMYLRNYAATMFEPTMKDKVANGRMLIDNFLYIQRLQGEMHRFLNKFDFGEFTHHKDLFEKTHKDLIAKTGG